jgi:hypothetical protein
MHTQPLGRLALLLAFATALISPACKKDDGNGLGPDLTKPVIAVSNPASLAATATAGGSLPLVFRVTDDRALSQIRIEAHNAFDGHGHGKTAALQAWSLDTIISATGRTSFDVNLSLRIPDSAATGPYHIVLNALDASGNAATFVEIDVVLSSPSAPTVSDFRLNNTPYPTTAEIELSLPAGADSLPQLITALVEDDIALQRIDVVLAHGHDKTAHEVYEATFSNLVGTRSYALSTRFPFRRADLEHNGHYILIIKVLDTQGNYTFFTRELHVTLN